MRTAKPAANGGILAAGRQQTRPKGLEPSTFGSTVRCSNQLSYGPERKVRIKQRPTASVNYFFDGKAVFLPCSFFWRRLAGTWPPPAGRRQPRPF